MMLRFSIGVLLLTSIASAQSTAPGASFGFRPATAATRTSVNSGGTVQFGPAPIGQPARVSFAITNSGQFEWTLSRVTATGAFTAASPERRLSPGATLEFEITCTPTTREPLLGTLTIEIRTDRSYTYTFTLAANGVTSDLIVSYLPSGGNQTPVREGEPLDMGNVAVGQSATATVFITNRGNSPGTVTGVVPEGGDAFRISGLPLLPVEIAPERDLRFTLTFTPTALTRSVGYIRLNMSTGSRLLVVQGQGVGPNLTWLWRDAPAAPGGALSFADTSVGSNATEALVIRNDGTADARIVNVSISGTGFSLADALPLPLQIAPGASLRVPVVFAPREAGSAAGKLRIDNFLFDLTGVGVGSRLTFTSIGETGSVSVTPGGSISFVNTAVGSSVALEFQIENTGTAEASVASIGATGSAFNVGDVPQLPLRLAPGQRQSFRIRFVPDAIGALAGTLQVDDFRFSLRGNGTQPELVGNVIFRLVGDTAQPLQQPAVGLSLERPYPIPLSGRLTIGFTSDVFSDDPNIQFATGGRTVDFRIPANTTDAIFGDSARQVMFQAGTLAGQITLTPSFHYGSVDLTPQPAPVKQVTVARTVPGISNVQVISKSASSVEIVVTGHSTTRSVARMNLQFTPVPGRELQTSRLIADVEGAFAAWYQSNASRSFGSLFSATLTLNSSGDFSAVKSVTVTASNSSGESSPTTVDIQ